MTDATAASGETADTDREDLPGLTDVRPRALTSGGEPAVELRFTNGARIRYRGTVDGIREEWFNGTGAAPVRSHAATSVVPHGAGGQGDVATAGRPDTQTLADRALCTVGSYLDFDGRSEAELSWGQENVAVLCGDAESG